MSHLHIRWSNITGTASTRSLRVLHDFFDGFLYWALGARQVALRFPGILSDDLLDGYDLNEFVT
jgi:hypothetical protein